MKPVNVIEDMLHRLKDKDVLEIMELILTASVVSRRSTIFKLEKMIKESADFERITFT